MLKGIKNFLLKKLLTSSDLLGSFVRHALTGLGSVLIALPTLTPEVVTPFTDSAEAVVVGIVLYLVGQVSSVLEKKGK